MFYYQAIWTTETCKVTNETDTDFSPATDGKWVFFACADRVQAFDIFTGEPTISYFSCDECAGQPIVTDDILIAKSRKGLRVYNKVRCLQYG